jgi:predicted dithiol-disulfide oxidoreductase (DUF899 family)
MVQISRPVPNAGAKRSETSGGFLDVTSYGRQENWEDSRPAWPQTEPYQWWRRHDEYQASAGREQASE